MTTTEATNENHCSGADLGGGALLALPALFPVDLSVQTANT